MAGELDQLLGEVFFGGLATGMLAVGVLVAVVLALALYAYQAIAWMTISRKLKCSKGWVAWIPLANIGLILHLGGFHWAWAFLVLLPILGWIPLAVLMIIASWRVFESRGYPGWFVLSVLIPQVGTLLFLIALGFVAWNDKPKGAMKASNRTRSKR